jgi:hypothetical protein
MAKPAKEIYTFTSLLLRAAKLYKSDPVEYAKLFDGGSEKLIPGLKVGATPHGTGNGSIYSFNYYVKGTRIAEISGSKKDGKCYTRYQLEIRISDYRKTVMRWLPISLPAGVAFKRWVPATFYNADGSEMWKTAGGFKVNSRGSCGVVCTTNTTSVFLRDKDGKMLDFSHREEGEIQRGLLNYFRSPLDIQLGFLPGSVGKEAWYESMLSPLGPDGEKLWDSAMVRMAAARVHREALKIQERHKHLKIALYPMLKQQDDLAGVRLTSRFVDRRFSPIGSHCLARDRHLDGVFYYLPQLVMYWTVSAAKAGYMDSYGEQIRCVQVIIPPHGNYMLKAGSADDSPFRSTYRWGGDSAQRSLKRGTPLERCYHTLRVLKKGVTAFDANRAVMLNDLKARDKLVYWPDNHDKVICSDLSPDEMMGYGLVVQATECVPEEAFAGIIERELIDSMPLC